MPPQEPRIIWKHRVFNKIRRMDATKKALHDFAKKGANAAGDGFVARASDHPSRARAAVIAATIRARRAEARDHILMGRVIDAMKS